MKILTELRYSFFTTVEREILDAVKKELCDIAVGYGTEQKSTAEVSDNEKTYELPDGNIIHFQWPRF